jgi:hypothetical protein
LLRKTSPISTGFTNRELPDSLADQKLEAPVELSGMSFDRLDPSLFFAEGQSKVIIRLTRPSVAEQGLLDSAAVASATTCANNKLLFSAGCGRSIPMLA